MATAFHDITVNEERPELSDVDKVMLRYLEINVTVFGVKNRFGVDELEKTLVFKFPYDSM